MNPSTREEAGGSLGLADQPAQASETMSQKTHWRKSTKVDLQLPRIHTHTLVDWHTQVHVHRTCTCVYKQRQLLSLVSPRLCLLVSSILFIPVCLQRSNGLLAFELGRTRARDRFLVRIICLLSLVFVGFLYCRYGIRFWGDIGEQ